MSIAAAVAVLGSVLASSPGAQEPKNKPVVQSVQEVKFQPPELGFVYVQFVYSDKDDKGYAVVAHVGDEAVRILNIVGPMRDTRDWVLLYDKMVAFRSFRLGGVVCDKPASGCLENVAAPNKPDKIARAPHSPDPPPPDFLGGGAGYEKVPSAEIALGDALVVDD